VTGILIKAKGRWCLAAVHARRPTRNTRKSWDQSEKEPEMYDWKDRQTPTKESRIASIVVVAICLAMLTALAFS